MQSTASSRAHQKATNEIEKTKKNSRNFELMKLKQKSYFSKSDIQLKVASNDCIRSLSKIDKPAHAHSGLYMEKLADVCQTEVDWKQFESSKYQSDHYLLYYQTKQNETKQP